jgi:hypothetical protein
MKPVTYIAAAILLGIFHVLAFLGCQDMGSADIPQDTLPQDQNEEGVLFTAAGIAGEPGNGGNDGNAVEAHLTFPRDVTVGLHGELYIVDCSNHCIRLVETDGIITRYIGSGNPGDDVSGPAGTADFDEPSGLTIGPDGDYWIASWNNWKLKRVSLLTMEVSIPAGTTAGFSGDGGQASLAQLNLPSSIVFDDDGNIYVSDQANQRIRKIDTSMTISTFAGTGAKGYQDGAGDQALFSFPDGAGAVPAGRIAWAHHPDGLLVADTENHRVRYIVLETREVFTIAGTGQAGYSGEGGAATSALLNYPTDVLMTEDHEIFIADSRNHVIRKVNAVGQISTVAGNGIPGWSPDGTAATSARLNNPSGISFHEPSRTLYIADTDNHQVRKVKLPR